MDCIHLGIVLVGRKRKIPGIYPTELRPGATGCEPSTELVSHGTPEINHAFFLKIATVLEIRRRGEG